MVAHTFIQVDQQPVINGIPTGPGFKEDAESRIPKSGNSVDVWNTRNHHRRGEIDVGSSSTVWSVRNSAACKIEIHVLATRLPLGVEELNRPTRVGLIHVKKAAE